MGACFEQRLSLDISCQSQHYTNMSQKHYEGDSWNDQGTNPSFSFEKSPDG